MTGYEEPVCGLPEVMGGSISSRCRKSGGYQFADEEASRREQLTHVIISYFIKSFVAQ